MEWTACKRESEAGIKVFGAPFFKKVRGEKMEIYYQDKNLIIRPLQEEDCGVFAEGFAAQGWNKPLCQFQKYLEEQKAGSRKVVAAQWQGEAAGYATLLPGAEAGPFVGKGWPEITDFNVLRKFQRRGIGNRILDTAEQLAARTSGQVVLGVGLHSGYGSAQRLYVKRGYVPDGSGVWYEDGPLGQYESCNNDDNLVLYLSKKLQKRELRQLKEEELAPQLFAYFDRFQPVERCWRKIDGNWIIKDVPFTERWGEAEYLELTECLMRTVKTGGFVWGVFLDGKLKGFTSVEADLLGGKCRYADLSCIHVSADCRGEGLGRLLFLKAAESAVELGAEKLYISAHSSVESQAFYRSMGCAEAEEYNARYVELEPCDCQLEYLLG